MHRLRLLLDCCTALLVVQCSALSIKPARIRVAKSVAQPVVHDATIGKHSNHRLHEYMQLPAAQYTCVPMPLNASLTRVYGTADEFHLSVPPLHFRVPGVPAVDVHPEMVARVTIEHDRVVISSDCCTIHGSPIIERLALNDRFEFRAHACLTWDEAQDDYRADDHHAHNVVVDNQEEQRQQAVTPTIHARTEIEVDFVPPGPFARVPRKLLEMVGNLGMSFATSALQKEFARGLAGDYERWATDRAYRIQRKNMMLELESELKSSNIHHNEQEKSMC